MRFTTASEMRECDRRAETLADYFATLDYKGLP